jgi:hypothetical protein
MKVQLDQRIVNLITGPKHWFNTLGSFSGVVCREVDSSVAGVYCLWWKNPTAFPSETTVTLPAGKRGELSAALVLWRSGLVDSVPLYVGKGQVRTRLVSHLQPAKQSSGEQSRNPYWWLSTVFRGKSIEHLMRESLGFSFIEEPNKLEQIYAENLAIGILRPWFNFRFTA